MSNANSLLYFVSQSYRQVQLSIEKGTDPYTLGEFNRQFNELLDASGDEEYTKKLTIMLVEETARLKQTTDHLRQEMAFEAKSSVTGNRLNGVEHREPDFGANRQPDLSNRRMGRRGN